MVRRSGLVLSMVLAGCGGQDDIAECAPPRQVIDGVCTAPAEPDPCPPGNQVVTDGSCQAAGIPPGACAEGFAHDGDVGCTPILPSERCADGLTAVPGDSACREVMPCGSGPWGDLPVDDATVYVDASYPGSDSDGTAGKPWHTIAEGYAAATAGALIAVAAGHYLEDLTIIAKPVRLWGVCPSKVEVEGTGARLVTLLIQAPANGTEVGGLAITGPEIGLALTGSVDVRLDRLWVHDNGWRGILLQNTSGVVEASISDVLVERAHDVGLYVAASTVQIDRLEVRGTGPRAGVASQVAGVRVEPECPMGQSCNAAAPAFVAMADSLIDANQDRGVSVSASSMTLSATVIRDTVATLANAVSGRGLTATPLCDANDDCDPASRANVTLIGSLITGSSDLGVQIAGGDAVIDSTVVQNTLPQLSTGAGGRGISIQPPCAVDSCDTDLRPSVSITNSVVEGSHQSGIFLAATDGKVRGVVVRDTLPQLSDGWYGHGMNIQTSCSAAGCDAGSGSVIEVLGSVVERSVELGIAVTAASGRIDSTLVRDTRDRNGLLGDGVVVWSTDDPAVAEVSHSHIEQSVRAGLSSFGGGVTLSTTTIQCAGVELSGEVQGGFGFSYTDGGGNRCGCPDAVGPCQVQSAGLEPPSAVGY